ncbi:hypothetical protein L596_004190 [Steinernema carpocapsae]|uniref:Uncharacterized protein n=1 Tax=Steinernema carpocapsae TaxID=34508 RepID=A0A4V6I883_STECR|nr:hypothetical protein L596_004190 [Steinernema carpocapsae]
MHVFDKHELLYTHHVLRNSFSVLTPHFARYLSVILQEAKICGILKGQKQTLQGQAIAFLQSNAIRLQIIQNRGTFSQAQEVWKPSVKEPDASESRNSTLQNAFGP